MIDQLTKLNVLTGLLENTDKLPVSLYELDFSEKGMTSSTILFDKHSTSVFSLSPVCGCIKQYKNDSPMYNVPEDYIGPVIMHRAIIGIDNIDYLNTSERVRSMIDKLHRGALKDIINQIGTIPNEGYHLSIHNPGADSFFTLLNNNVAVELRFFLYKDN